MTLSIKEQFEKDLKQQNGQEPNFKKFYGRLTNAQDYITVRNITTEYFSEQDKLANGQYMFSKDDANKFWELQKELKDKYFPAHVALREATVRETEELIYGCREIYEVKVLKKSIFNNPILDSRTITAPLYDECDKRILALEQEVA